MPILIYLKNPSRVLPVKGRIDPDNKDVIRQYEEMYGRGTLVTRTVEGNAIVIPAIADLNIAFLQEVSENDLEKMKKKSEQKQKQTPGQKISSPKFAIPNLKNLKKN